MESELREGYKMTEMGALPEEWEVVELKRYIKILTGYPFDSSKFNEKSGFPLIRIRDLNKKNPETFYDGDYDAGFIVKQGDVLVGMDGDFNVVRWNNYNGLLNQRICKIDSVPKKADQYYIYYTLIGNIKKINDITPQTTVKHLSTKDINNLLIPLPTLPEQHRIATILSTFDETVEHTEALIEKYKNIKAGLMADLLKCGIDEEGRIRSEETHRFKDSVIGRVPEEWEFGGFEDMVDKSNKNAIKPGPFGSSLKKEFYVGDGYRVYGQEQVIAGTLSIGDYYVNKHKFEELKSFRIDMDDVLISLVGTTGKVLVVPSKFEPGIINPRLLKITPDKRKSNSKFISYLLISGIITNQLATLSHGGTMDVLNGTTIRKLRFGIPQFPEQRRIVEILTAVDQRIEKEEAYRDKLLQLKKGLMQDLLTGKVRVSSVSK